MDRPFRPNGVFPNDQVPYSDSETGSDWTGLTPNPPESPGYSWQRSAGHYSPLSQPRSSIHPDDDASGNHLKLPRTSSLPTMSPLSSRLTVCSRYSEDDLTPWITTRDRGRRRSRPSAAAFAAKLAAARGCSPSKLSENGSSTSSSDGLWRETQPLHFPLNADEDEAVTGRLIPGPGGGDGDHGTVKKDKGGKEAGSSHGDQLAWRAERFPHALVPAGGDDRHGSLAWKGFGIRAALADILRAVKCIFHACLPPDRRRQP